MRLVIQVTSFNEADHIAQTLAALPREVAGFAQTFWLVSDDGSSDRTLDVVAEVAPTARVFAQPTHRGYGFAYRAGLRAALALGADVVVTTDADNQYVAEDIPLLLAPIVQGEADLVIGARPIWKVPEFSTVKKILQDLGSAVVRGVSHTRVADATSGFRAWSRAAASAVPMHSDYTGTVEAIIAAGRLGLRVVSVPVRINPPRRASRLMSSVPSYVGKQSLTIAKSWWRHRSDRGWIKK